MVLGGFFSHVEPSGQGLVRRLQMSRYLHSGLRYWRAGENLGWGREGSSTPLWMVRAWMGSPLHRANVLEPTYRELGIGVVSGVPGGVDGATYTTDFGVSG